MGLFNVYNFLYAYYAIKYLGYNLNPLKDKYYLLKEPPGRMEKVKYKSNNIFIDYAHTPDAVLNVLKTVSKVKNAVRTIHMIKMINPAALFFFFLSDGLGFCCTGGLFSVIFLSL